jgi:hypothetical protein
LLQHGGNAVRLSRERVVRTPRPGRTADTERLDDNDLESGGRQQVKQMPIAER